MPKNALSMTVFEEHVPFTNAAGAAEFINLYHERAAKAGIPDTSVEVQAATVDALTAALGWDRLDVVKMDIEGSEIAALDGMAALFASGCRPWR